MRTTKQGFDKSPSNASNLQANNGQATVFKKNQNNENEDSENENAYGNIHRMDSEFVYKK